MTGSGILTGVQPFLLGRIKEAFIRPIPGFIIMVDGDLPSGLIQCWQIMTLSDQQQSFSVSTKLLPDQGEELRKIDIEWDGCRDVVIECFL